MHEAYARALRSYHLWKRNYHEEQGTKEVSFNAWFKVILNNATRDFKRAERGGEGILRGIVAHLLFSSCLALLALLCAAFFFHQGALRSDDASAKLAEEIGGVVTEIEALEQQGLPAELYGDLFQDPTLLELLMDIAQKMPDKKAGIEEIKISAQSRGAWVTIEGLAKNDSGFNEVFEDLQNSEFLDVDPEPSKILDVGGTRYTIQAFRPEEGVSDDR